MMAVDGTVVLPPPGNTSAGNATAPGGAGGGNATQLEYLGCIIANNTLLSGTPLETRGGVDSAEACCRACRADARCQLFQFCDQPQGCTYQYGPYIHHLDHRQCEWGWMACCCLGAAASRSVVRAQQLQSPHAARLCGGPRQASRRPATAGAGAFRPAPSAGKLLSNDAVGPPINFVSPAMCLPQICWAAQPAPARPVPCPCCPCCPCHPPMQARCLPHPLLFALLQPPAVIEKGPGVPFIGGLPLALPAPGVPGFQELPGRNQFKYTGGSFTCGSSAQ